MTQPPRLQNSAPAPTCLVGLALSPPRKSQALHLTLKVPEAAQLTEVPTSMETLFFFLISVFIEAFEDACCHGNML